MDDKIFNQILEVAFQKKVSDVHFQVDNPPFFRARGQFLRSKLPKLSGTDTEFIVRRILEHNGRLASNDLKELDTSFSLPSGGRFRVSIFRQKGCFGIVMRLIPPHIGSFTELNLPPVLGEIVQAPNGMILVTGPTGNGKSTTLASMLRFINESFSYNIITIEDPIEFLFSSQKSCIVQREVGIDTGRHHAALESRACEWIPMSYSSERLGQGNNRWLHQGAGNRSSWFSPPFIRKGAVSTINRIIGHFPPESQEIVRPELADILGGHRDPASHQGQNRGRISCLSLK